jgi:hypothetical protein
MDTRGRQGLTKVTLQGLSILYALETHFIEMGQA